MHLVRLQVIVVHCLTWHVHLSVPYMSFQEMRREMNYPDITTYGIVSHYTGYQADIND